MQTAMQRHPPMSGSRFTLAPPFGLRRIDICLDHPALAAIRWTASVLALAALLSAAIFVLLLIAARQLHTGIEPPLARKLFLLDHAPGLIIAGDSRMGLQVDPVMAANLLGKPRGYAVNIGVAGGDVASVARAVEMRPERFRNADLIVGVSPYHINDGAKKDFYYATPLINRLTTAEQLSLFLPRHVASLVRYIREAAVSFALSVRPAAPDPKVERLLGYSPPPPATAASRRVPSAIHDGPYDRDWTPHGIKTRHLRSDLCSIRQAVRRLVVVSPPFRPAYEAVKDSIWDARVAEFHQVLERIGAECGFEVVLIDSVPGMGDVHFRDGGHLDVSGVPIFTRHLFERLGYLAGRP